MLLPHATPLTEEERARYDHDTDKDMTLVKAVDRATNTPTSCISWFAVHCTSIGNRNTLLHGDNKGVASAMLEASMGPGFVAAFAQASVGDTSPNTQGAFCNDTGLPCDPIHSTCNGRNELCMGRGPGT